jgi:hypothetical protein
MKRLLLPIAAAVTFGAAPYASKMGVVAGSAWLVVLGVLLATAASASVSSLAITAGAIGAFGGNVLGSIVPAAGGAVLVGLAYAERTMRVRGTNARLVHVASSLVVGALAGSLAAAYSHASPAVRGVAMLVCAVLVALPLLVDADDPLATVLEGAARRISGPAGASLRDAAELRRQAHDVPLDESTVPIVAGTWRALRKLAESRVRLERSRPLVIEGSPANAVLARVDQRIAEHVTALARAYTAADTARAAATTLDDVALKDAQSALDTLEETSRALVTTDDKQDDPASPQRRIHGTSP